MAYVASKRTAEEKEQGIAKLAQKKEDTLFDLVTHKLEAFSPKEGLNTIRIVELCDEDAKHKSAQGWGLLVRKYFLDQRSMWSSNALTGMKNAADDKKPGQYYESNNDLYKSLKGSERLILFVIDYTEVDFNNEDWAYKGKLKVWDASKYSYIDPMLDLNVDTRGKVRHLDDPVKGPLIQFKCSKGKQWLEPSGFQIDAQSAGEIDLSTNDEGVFTHKGFEKVFANFVPLSKVIIIPSNEEFTEAVETHVKNALATPKEEEPKKTFQPKVGANKETEEFSNEEFEKEFFEEDDEIK